MVLEIKWAPILVLRFEEVLFRFITKAPAFDVLFQFALDFTTWVLLKFLLHFISVSPLPKNIFFIIHQYLFSRFYFLLFCFGLQLFQFLAFYFPFGFNPVKVSILRLFLQPCLLLFWFPFCLNQWIKTFTWCSY